MYKRQVGADQHALDALAVISAEAFARLQLTDEMVHYARHDPLTDLPNRGILLDRVAQALHRARRRGVVVALLFVDLDAFKPVNDLFGHAAGDAVLIEVGERLLTNTRDTDTVARLGGDEFAVLLEDVAVGEVIEISDRILVSLAAGVEVGGHKVPLAASIGIAYGDGTESGETLLRHADLAMYEAKGRGKAQSVAYEPSIGRARMERLELADELREAIARRELRVVYQPVVAVDTGRITGVEALVRWRLNGTDIPADFFVRIAEETGLVGALGAFVLETVSENAPAMRTAAAGPLSISVNISARQLLEPGFVPAVKRALRATGDNCLVLEITERQEIGDDAALDVMRHLEGLGVRFAVDDFGVGFSSISYLRHLPVHVVKTDGALAHNIDTDERACAVLRAVTAMAEALDLDVIVEGVEREAQLTAVREQVRAPYVQGYLLHRPMPLAALVEVLTAQSHSGEPPAEPNDQLTPIAL